MLILFSDSADDIQSYFIRKKCLVLRIDEGERYIWAVLLSFLRRRRGLSGYVSEVARTTKAQLIVSLQDNLAALYQLRQWLASTPVALIQNGLRSLKGDLLSEVRSSDVSKWQIDYYFGFTQASCDQVGELALKRLPIGSFRSNCVPKTSAQRDRVLSYISTLRVDIPLSTVIGGAEGTAVVSYGDILAERLRILREVLSFGMKEGLVARILGKGPEHFAEERFYREQLDGYIFEFVPRISASTQYLQVDRSFLTVSTSSTLGYESLARGNRTAVIQPDSIMLQDLSLRFGWPKLLDYEGPFWSTSAASHRINEVLHFVNSATDLQWKEALAMTSDVLPRFDSGNSIFVAHLARWGAQQSRTRANEERE